jgi:arginyl-tRNA synthetase
MLENLIKDEIQSSISILFNEHVKTDDIDVERPAKKLNGDFSSNISFALSQRVGKKPNEVAEILAGDLSKLPQFEKVTAAGPFLNFYVSSESYLKTLRDILSEGDSYGQTDIFKDQKIQLEFISANPTGPLTLANGRGGYGGDVIANLYNWCGAKVEREYYVNDGGNQVKILGDSILSAAGIKSVEGDTYKGPYIDEWVKNNQKVIHKYKDDSFALGQLAAKDILATLIKPSVKKMGIKYDVWFSEYEMVQSGLVEKVITGLKKYNHTKEEDGALWFTSSKFGDEKDRVLVKTDGEKTYFANDIAYLFDKLYNRKFDRVINIWGADHHGHVKKMLAAEEALGCDDQLTIIISQMVRLIKDGKEFKMSKRKGTYVTMNDLFELIGGTDKEASDVARFMFNSRSFNTHMDFDLDVATERSDKNPVFYVKYAYARIHGILDKAGKRNEKANLALIKEAEELDLISQLAQLPVITTSILTLGDYPVHHLTFYAIDLAKKFHVFYDKCRVIDESNPELTAARIELVAATETVMKIVMTKLLGIEAPKKM